MAFIQIIEYTTTNLEEVEAVLEEWVVRTEGQRSATRATFTADRDRPDTYVQIVEFPSYEAAMQNSSLPATSELAGRIAALCEEPPRFRNLDVQRVDLG